VPGWTNRRPAYCWLVRSASKRPLSEVTECWSLASWARAKITVSPAWIVSRLGLKKESWATTPAMFDVLGGGELAAPASPAGATTSAAAAATANVSGRSARRTIRPPSRSASGGPEPGRHTPATGAAGHGSRIRGRTGRFLLQPGYKVRIARFAQMGPGRGRCYRPRRALLPVPRPGGKPECRAEGGDRRRRRQGPHLGHRSARPLRQRRLL